MNFNQLTDLQILAELARRSDHLRRSKGYTDSETAQRGGLGLRTLVAFQSASKDITLSSFIRILRGLGELERLERLLPPAEPIYSPAEARFVEPPKRIRKPRAKRVRGTFSWGDEP